MKILFCISTYLSVLWLTNAAPQPLSIINSTSINLLDGITTDSISETSVSDSGQNTTSSTVSDTPSTSHSDDSTSESSTELANLREEVDSSSNESLTNTGSTVQTASAVTESKITDISKDVTDSIASTEVFSKPALNEEIVSESDVPITRYVPPLDPLKHMLMMADIKGMPKIANLVPKVNLRPPTSTSDPSTIKDIESTTEFVSSENPDIIEKVVAESSEIDENLEKIVTTETSTMETDSLFRGSTEKILFETSESSVENSEENVSLQYLDSEESHSTAISETTVSDLLPSSTLLLDSEEFKSVTDSVTDASSVSDDSTQKVSTSTIISETILTSTVKPIEIILTSTLKPIEINETLPLHRNLDEMLKSDETIIDSKESTTLINDETSDIIFSTTEVSVIVDNLTNSDNLIKNVEEKSSTTLIVAETTSASTSTERSEIELKNVELDTTRENKDLISTTSTTAFPETTFESNITTLEIEKKNITLDDELEFRAVKIPVLNASKVSYVKNEPIVEPETVTSDSSITSEAEIESTASSIFTTIAEILFSSSTTEIPESPIEEKNEEIGTSETAEEYVGTEETLVVEKLELKSESDTGAVLSNDSADMLKVHSGSGDLDSFPAKETSTLSPATESIATVTLPEEKINEDLEVDSEKKVIDEESEKLVESFEDTNTTTSYASSTTTESTTKISPSTSTEASVTTVASVTESESEKLEDEVDDIIESEIESQTSPTSTEKSSDYLLNVQNRYVSGDNRDMVAAVQFLHYHDKASSEQCFKLVDAHWNYATNLTEDNKKKQLEQTLEYSLFHKAAWKNATSFAWKSFNDTLLRRWFKSLSVLGTAALPEDKLNEFNRLKAEMKNKYSTAKICTYVPKEAVRRGQILREKDCNLTLEPDLQRILTKSRDYDELVHVWKSWRDAAGKPIRDKYLRFVELSNEAARMNGFSDTGDMWREAYESETFESDLEELWDQLKPLYENLHAYVRRRLIQQYGADKIKENGPIPAHLFGNMWAQSWVSLLDITQPFPGKPSVDVTPVMEAKNMTSYEMFKISEEFFTSLGLKPMPEPFWKHSLIEKPKDREIICHASAWDFCNGKDYRIKQCTDITMEDLITVHHEMGHIQYFLQYARQPNVFREGANPGFHEAIGDVLALSVSTPKHLKSIGLLDSIADDPEGDLNFLLYTALDKVSFLPSGYLIDLWRWGLFSGDIKPEEMNSKWWELRLKYQGVCPPLKRTDTDFDPGAKFHVPGNVPYIRYFVSFVIQFQFHKVLCDAAGHTGPLYKCDIYRSTEAGQILSQVMELGSSEHWSEAMKIMTGGATNKMDAGPILEYFDPLLQFLKEQNKNETIGWQSLDPTVCP